MTRVVGMEGGVGVTAKREVVDHDHLGSERADEPLVRDGGR